MYVFEVFFSLACSKEILEKIVRVIEGYKAIFKSILTFISSMFIKQFLFISVIKNK
jgi:hypothetical protein